MIIKYFFKFYFNFFIIISDIFLINIWTHEIGKSIATNFGLLYNVIKFNLQLFKDKCIKKIIFILEIFSKRIQNNK